MRCDNCKNKKFHPAGSWYAVAEGGDDPYNYDYCNKGHWCGDSTIPVSEECVGIEDQFAECPDFKNLNEASENKPYTAVSGSLPLASEVYSEQDLKDEFEQAIKRRNQDYAEGYIEGIQDGAICVLRAKASNDR